MKNTSRCTLDTYTFRHLKQLKMITCSHLYIYLDINIYDIKSLQWMEINGGWSQYNSLLLSIKYHQFSMCFVYFHSFNSRNRLFMARWRFTLQEYTDNICSTLRNILKKNEQTFNNYSIDYQMCDSLNRIWIGFVLILECSWHK